MSEVINEEKFSPVFGFEPGVVVEIGIAVKNGFDRSTFYFERYDQASDSVMLSTHWPISAFSKLNRWCENIKSIRILSGPFRFWSEDVPEWAEVHHHAVTGRSAYNEFGPQSASTWWSTRNEIDPTAWQELETRNRILNDSYSITHRPWWHPTPEAPK
jgi:hypothetical protein